MGQDFKKFTHALSKMNQKINNNFEKESEIEAEESGLEEKNLREKIKKLKNDLKECQKEKMEYLTGWQRAKADFVNARKEEEKLKTEFVKFAEFNLFKKILPVVDGFERAFSDKKWQTLDKEWQNGIKNIYNSLQKILENYNIEIIKTEKEYFNPKYHEAIETEKVKDKSQDQIILKEIQKGYAMNDKVLRAAKVKVGIFKDEE
jgi:molecular chaperone GrpE